MSSYETVEVLYQEKDEATHLPVEVTIEKQQRVRDDESKTRPFIKIRFSVGNRHVYCDVEQATSLATLLTEAIPYAEAAITQLREEQEQRRKEAQERRESRGKKRGGMQRQGATAREREKERKGEKKAYSQKKAEKAEKDRALRQSMRGR